MHKGLGCLNLVGDNQSSLFQLMRLKGGVGLDTQQRVLRRIIYLLGRSKLTVYVHWVPSELMPADPISRYLDDSGGYMYVARAKADVIFEKLRQDHSAMRFMGVVGDQKVKKPPEET